MHATLQLSCTASNASVSPFPAPAFARRMLYCSRGRMNNNPSLWRRTAFLLSFLSAGIPYWLIPYREVSLPSTLIGPGLVIIVLAALLLRACGITPFWKTARTLGWALAAAVIVRVLVEGMRDPSSHNLWPFEVAIALLLGFACSLTGAAIGSLIARLRGSGSSTIESGQP